MMVQSAQALSADEKRRRMVIGTMRRNGYAPDALIETLHTVQSAFGYLDDTSLRFVAHELHIPLSKVFGVAPSYHVSQLRPRGGNGCFLCLETAGQSMESQPV